MNLFPFYKQTAPRQFDHKPIYYDKQKEEREERIKRVKKELGMDQEDSKEKKDYEGHIRGSFNNAVPGGSSREKLAKTNRTVMIIFIALLAIILLVYYLI